MIDDSVVPHCLAYIAANYKPASIPLPGMGTRRVMPSGVSHLPVGVTERLLSFLRVNHDDKTTFASRLEELRVAKGMTPVQLYDVLGADIGKRVYSKITRGLNRPSKNTVIQLGLALHLDEAGMNDLLKTVSFTLSGNIRSDVVIKFCLENKIYAIYDVNYLLMQVGEKVLCLPARKDKEEK